MRRRLGTVRLLIMSQETVIVRLPTARIRARKVSGAKSRAKQGNSVEVPSQGLVSLAFYAGCAVGLEIWDGLSRLVSRLAQTLKAAVKRQ